MKQAKFILLAIVVFSIQIATAQVAINNDGAAPDASAILDISGTEGGFLLPRMLMEQRDSIANPAAGLLIYCLDCKELQIYNGDEWTNLIGGMASTNIPTVTNSETGRIWMDKNLGASKVADSITDTAAYGDLYQWGRFTDGHEIVGSTTIDELSSQDDPGHGFYIQSSTAPNDWRDPQNPALWQGMSGINNPCPNGFRLPSKEEWNDEKLTWDSQDAEGAFNSDLKLTTAGVRLNSGELIFDGERGGYWSSTFYSTYATYLEIKDSGANLPNTYRSVGCNIRCIKD